VDSSVASHPNAVDLASRGRRRRAARNDVWIQLASRTSVTASALIPVECSAAEQLR
jgi:hypothetical protein